MVTLLLDQPCPGHTMCCVLLPQREPPLEGLDASRSEYGSRHPPTISVSMGTPDRRMIKAAALALAVQVRMAATRWVPDSSIPEEFNPLICHHESRS